jgi:acetyl-CoA carboxylase biotin carboxyl carrier protein
MDLRKLKTLIDLVAESGISELEVTEGEGKVRIVKQPPQVMAAPMAMPQYQQLPAAAPAVNVGGAPAAAAAEAPQSRLVTW